jgi:hypothetical protein
MPMRDLDEHATPHDVGTELLEPGDTLADIRFDVVAMLQAVKGDLGWDERHSHLVTSGQCSPRANSDPPWQSDCYGVIWGFTNMRFCCRHRARGFSPRENSPSTRNSSQPLAR